MVDGPTNLVGKAKPRAVQTLPYADPIAQLGVTIHREAGVTTVTVPPPSGLRMLFSAHWVLIGFFGLRAYAAWDDGQIAVGSTVICVGAFVHLVYTFWRRRIFLVSDREVRFGRLKARGYIWEETWPRQAVGEIKVNAYNGKLLIRITGEDMKEYFISSNRDVTRQVAEVLNAELSSPMVAAAEA
jgi:hypothetical protein